MYLKRLELNGFKSFAKKTILEFNDGINGVVGPNGSGKSNISDAITWVLGEQSSKTLRGLKMDDVIFNGTEHRRAMSYAEVSLVLDNEDKAIDSDYNEVYVTRKIYRNGDTDYLINNKRCRLKDIYELFMDTGIGKDGYSIIGQGKIDKIINSKPEERRSIFEEAVGIVKYRTRKTEALAKLKKEKENLDRVTDIIAEIENQLIPLQEQSEVAKKYLKLEDRLRNVSISSFKITLDEAEELVKQYETDIQNLEQDLIQSKNDVLKLQLVSKSVDAKKVEVNESIQVSNDNISEIKINIQKEDNNINLSKQKINNINDNIARVKSEIETFKQSIIQKENEIEEIENKIYNNKLSITQKNSSLLAYSTERNLLNAKFGENQEKTSDIENQIIENYNQVSHTSLGISEKNARLEALQEKVDKLKLENADKMNELENILSNILVLSENLESVSSELDRLEDIEENTKNIVNSKTLQFNSLKNEYIEVEKQLNNSKNKLQILKDLEAENQGLYESVKHVIKNKQKIDDELEVVANIINVPKNLEIAMEVALGGSLNYVVTKDTSTASKGIELLKRDRRGRVTFLPLSKIRSRYIKPNFINSGILGIASDLVEYDGKYKNIVENLLGNILIVDNLQNAIKINENNKTHRIVTLEGDVLNTSGFMTGGSVRQSGAKIFSRKREITEHSDNIIDLNEQLEFLKNDILEINKELNENKELLELTTKSISQKTISKAEYSNKKAMLDERKEFLQSNISGDEEVEKSMMQIEVLKAELNKLEKSHESLLIIQNNLKAEKDSFNVGVGDIQTKRDELVEKINNVKLEIASLQNENNHLEIQKENTQDEIQVYNKNITNLNIDIVKFKSTCENVEIDIEKFNNNIEQYKTDIKLCEQDIENKKKDLVDLQEESIKVSKNIDSARQQVSNVEKSKYTIEMKNNQLHERINDKYEELWQKYEMSHNDIMEFPAIKADVDVLRKEERELQRNIKDLGAVNVNAIDQFEETNNRYEFLVNQKEDILKSEEQLIEIIQELSTQMEEQFRREFEIINNNFSKVFKELFNGGSAKLQLTDKENILETGVEIVAEPPGKKLKNLMLLSGGEKAMTAIALLFAILNYKPSPFCVLDEIDSALDDSNIDRYAEFLNKHSDDTQFIVITHRKGTMERAEVLYGITMQEQGISTLVSAEF